MKKVVLIFVLALILSGCTLPSIGSKNSGINITSNPVSTVVLDGEKLSQTPLKKTNLKSGKHKLQLLPSSGQPWETEIILSNNLETVVDHIFGAADQDSETYAMYLEKIGDKTKSEINVITIPDRAIVRLDGQPKGFAPVLTNLPDSAGHQITVSSAGYKEKNISIQAIIGYRLNITVQLARSQLLTATPSPTATPSAELTTPTPTGSKPKISPTPPGKPSTKPTSTPPERPYVEIQNTPTGWLKVRSEPTAVNDNNVITKVNPGETYTFIEANESGWYKITLTDGKEGWVSGQYAKLYK